MPTSKLVLLRPDHDRLVAILDRLAREANARTTILLDKTGHQIAIAGDIADLDPTSLASLVAGNVAATDGLARLVGETEFSVLFHEGERDHIHINVFGRFILVVLFDERSSLGLVRLRVQRAAANLREIIDGVLARGSARRPVENTAVPVVGEITDEDIEALFG